MSTCIKKTRCLLFFFLDRNKDNVTMISLLSFLFVMILFLLLHPIMILQLVHTQRMMAVTDNDEGAGLSWMNRSLS